MRDEQQSLEWTASVGGAIHAHLLNFYHRECALRLSTRLVPLETFVFFIAIFACCVGCSPSEAELQKQQAEQAVTRLTSASTPEEQEAAIAELKTSPAAAAVLKETLESGDPRQQEKIVIALGKIGPPGLPVLQELLSGDDLGLRLSAISALEHQGEAGVPLLVEALETRSEDQDHLLRSLARMGPTAASAATNVAKLLDSPDSLTRYQAAETLQRFGPAAASILPKLKAQLEQETDSGAHLALAEAALSIGRGDAVAWITPYFSDEQKSYSYSMLIADQLGAEALPGLRASLNDPNVEVRRQTVFALRYLDEDAQDALPDLKRRLPLESDGRLKSDIESLIKEVEEDS